MLKFSKNGNYLAYCQTNRGDLSLIVIYDLLDNSIIQRLGYFLGLIYDISWAPNDRLIAGASQDGSVKIFNLDDD